ncbi:MAG: hypothetical protein ABIP65_06035 [Vicinamibacterales bacterium]
MFPVDYRNFLRQNGRALEVNLRRSVSALVCLGLVASAFTMLRASQAAPTPPLKPMVPAAASSIASNPDAYIGQVVTIHASVDELVGPNAFTVDQDRTRHLTPILVVSGLLTAPVTLNAYVTVIGEVVRFDADEILRRVRVQLPGPVAATHHGKPVIIATSVLTGALVDLARRLPPPMTPEEEAFDAVMKRVNPAFAAARQAAADTNAESAKTQAVLLKQAFTETETFWKLRGKPDAVQWALDARSHVEAFERAAGTANWDEAKAATARLQQACSSCHGVHRERFDDGSYRIRGDK